MSLSNCRAVCRAWINAALPRPWAFTEQLKNKIKKERELPGCQLVANVSSQEETFKKKIAMPSDHCFINGFAI